MKKPLIQRVKENANPQQVVIIKAPRHSRARRLPDSYLACYMADEFGVISC